MIEIEMSRDIREFEPKIIAVFTTRQLTCVGIGVAYALPIAFLLPIDDVLTKMLIAIMLAAPAIVCGWVKMFDMYFDKFFINIMLPTFLNPQKRLYKTQNTIFEEKEEPKQKKKKIHYTKKCRPIK